MRTFCISIKIVMELGSCDCAIATKKTRARWVVCGGARERHMYRAAGRVRERDGNWAVQSNERKRERQRIQQSEWFFFCKRRAINFMLFSCFCYAIAFARIFCSTPDVLSSALTRNLCFFFSLILEFKIFVIDFFRALLSAAELIADVMWLVQPEYGLKEYIDGF